MENKEHYSEPFIFGILFIILVAIVIIIQIMKSFHEPMVPIQPDIISTESPPTKAKNLPSSHQSTEYPDDLEYDPNDIDADDIALEYPELAEDYYD